MATPPNWSTSSFGHAADTSPGERSALGEHLHLCHSAAGRLFALQCGGEALHRFLAARFVTTLVILALLIGCATLLG